MYGGRDKDLRKNTQNNKTKYSELEDWTFLNENGDNILTFQILNYSYKL